MHCPAILLPLLGHADRVIDNDKIAAVHESACGTKRTLDSRLLIALLKRVAEELKKRAAPANDRRRRDVRFVPKADINLFQSAVACRAKREPRVPITGPQGDD